MAEINNNSKNNIGFKGGNTPSLSRTTNVRANASPVGGYKPQPNQIAIFRDPNDGRVRIIDDKGNIQDGYGSPGKFTFDGNGSIITHVNNLLKNEDINIIPTTNGKLTFTVSPSVPKTLGGAGRGSRGATGATGATGSGFPIEGGLNNVLVSDGAGGAIASSNFLTNPNDGSFHSNTLSNYPSTTPPIGKSDNDWWFDLVAGSVRIAFIVSGQVKYSAALS